MKIKLKICIIFVVVISISSQLFSFLTVIAKTNTNTTTTDVKKISLNEPNLFLELDQSYNLTVEFTPKISVKGASVVWTTSNSNIVKVANGTVYATGIGTAYVYANCDSSMSFCKITVIRYNPVRAVQNKNFAGYSGTDLEVVLKAVDIIDKNIKVGMSDEEKVKAINKYLLKNCELYNSDIKNAPKRYYGLVGTLLEKMAVSQGYSYAFKYFMDILGIPSRTCQGSFFMWNLVNLNGDWYLVNTAAYELIGEDIEIQFNPEIANIITEVNWKIIMEEEVNFEYILSEYGVGSYSGNEIAIKYYLQENDSISAQDYTVILDTNFPFSGQFKVEGNTHITETIQNNESFNPSEIPYIKDNPNIYVSSFNTKADGTGISYPNNYIEVINENLYLYCIWTVNVEGVMLKLTKVKDSISLEWNKAKGCNDYELRYSTNSTMKSAITKNISGQKAKITGLKQKTTYYVQVRGYIKDDDGKITYGKWSTKKKVKTK